LDIKAITTCFETSETGFILFEDKSETDCPIRIKIVFMNTSAAKMFEFSDHPENDILKFFGDGIRLRHTSTALFEQNGFHIRMELLKTAPDLYPIRMILVSDLTEAVTMENKVSILTHALNSVQDAVYVINKDGTELFHNPRIKRFSPPHRKKLLAELNSVFKTGKRIKDNYIINKTLDNEPVHILSNYFPVLKNEKIIAVVSINKFVTEIHRWFRKAIDCQSQLEGCNLKTDSRQNGTRYNFDDIIGESKTLKSVCEKAQKAAQNFFPVLIQGETGVGKEMFAQSIHNESLNSNKPFVAVVCSAIPESLLESTLFGTKKGAFTGSDDTIGLFEQAGQGTLFLDEINSIPHHLQSKLLRVLEEKKVRRVGGYIERPIKCRIISATNEDAMDLIKQGLLREDLFYRIASIVLTIPPLREREKDILILTHHFLQRMTNLYGVRIKEVSPELKKVFENHRWPGNVRELSRVIEGSVNLIENEHFLAIDHLPDYFQPKALKHHHTEFRDKSYQGPLPGRLKKVEKKWILDELRKHDGNVSKSAMALGIKRQNLQSRMKKLFISKRLTFEDTVKD